MAATGRRVSREMIFPDWGFIRREAAVAWRAFHAPFRGIAGGLAALRNTGSVEEGAVDRKAMLRGETDLEVVVRKNENQPLPVGGGIDLIEGGLGEGMRLGPADLVFLKGGADFAGGLEEERLHGDDWQDEPIESRRSGLPLGDSGDDYKIGFGKPSSPETHYFQWEEDERAPDAGPEAAQTERIILEIETRLHKLMETSQRMSAPGARSPALAAAAQACSERRRLHALFGRRIFCDPSWDIMLELFVSTLEGRKVTVSTACMAACAPTTTALRHIAYLVKERLVVRRPHPVDARSTCLELTEQAMTRLTQYFSESKFLDPRLRAKRSEGSSIASSRAAGR